MAWVFRQYICRKDISVSKTQRLKNAFVYFTLMQRGRRFDSSSIMKYVEITEVNKCLNDKQSILCKCMRSIKLHCPVTGVYGNSCL